MNLNIRELQISDEPAFHEAKKAWDNAPGFIFLPRYEEGMNFKDYVDLLKDQRLGKRLPENFVPDTCHFGFLNGKIVGRVALRHKLNDFLLKIGGHIGYGVLPKYRGQGIATKLLVHAVSEAQKLNISPILVTCDEDNIASVKVIEKCGGTLENILPTENGPAKKRYWIKK